MRSLHRAARQPALRCAAGAYHRLWRLLVEPRRRSGKDLTVYTVGHSTRALDEFVTMLKAHGVARWRTCGGTRGRGSSRTSMTTPWRQNCPNAASRTSPSPPSAGAAGRRRTAPTPAGGAKASAATPTTCSPPAFQEALEELIEAGRRRAHRDHVRRGRPVAVPPLADRRRAARPGREGAGRDGRAKGPAARDDAVREGRRGRG